MVLTVQLESSPDVQLLGDAAVLRGAAALDVYRVLVEGIRTVRQRDAIEPNRRLQQAVAALKAASTASLASSVNERQPTPATLRSGQVVAAEEVGHVLGRSARYVTDHSAELGGWRGSGRGRPWLFDTGLVAAYIESQQQGEVS